jgi:5-methylcytosine-specific restriction endonuclease McrA
VSSRIRNRRRKRTLLANRDGGARCRYCGRRQRLRKFTIDHVVPLSRGGGGGLDNLALACLRCNQAKADRPLDEFLAAVAPI